MKLSLFFALLFANIHADYSVVFLVNARHLDYSSSNRMLKTIAKHPSDWSKNGDVGHAWLILNGEKSIEGGHSGELGVYQPRYMEGVVENAYRGAKNPISYLWCPQSDGFFQEGNGGHFPTVAAKIALTKSEYEAILAYIETYCFDEYSLTKKQCCHFVKGAAQVIGIELEDEVCLRISPFLAGLQMWEDPRYEYLIFSSPDRLEYSLKQLILKGRAENALRWYQKTHKRCFCRFIHAACNFPGRILRYLAIP